MWLLKEFVEAVEHFSDLLTQFICLIELRGFAEAETFGDDDLSLQLIFRAMGEKHEPAVVLTTPTPPPFCNIAGDRNGCAFHLRGETIDFG